MAKFVKVDIVHSSGATEKDHVVELADHSRLTVEQQVEDHLKLKYCAGVRGGWKYSNLSAPYVKTATTVAPVKPVAPFGPVAPAVEDKSA